MSRFRNTQTGVVVSVDDSKDARFVNGWEPAEKPAPKAPAKKAVAKKTASKKAAAEKTDEVNGDEPEMSDSNDEPDITDAEDN